ncbi:MAG: hypothetical protein FJ215_09710 [Ignavibacteria bacterium]|nr:hypothetical protein [Ignavibacteria bacterium]
MPQPRYDQHGRLLSDAEFIQRFAEAVTANVIAHYECGFTKDDLKVGVTPEGCVVATKKTYFETPIPNRLSPEEFQRLGNTLAALLDSIDARTVDAEMIERIRRENDVEQKKQAISEARRR